MNKYIGIRGHRGAGKKTVAYLLANTLNYISQRHHPEDEFEEKFNRWCQEIRESEHVVETLSLPHVIVEEFGDGPKMMVQMLTGIDLDAMNDDYSKDHVVVNLKDFSVGDFEDPKGELGGDLVTAKEYYMSLAATSEPQPIQQNVYMILREFILYFGIYVMQNAFGRNVWIKSLIANNKYYEGLFPDDILEYKIFCDIKARSKVTYIKDKGGVVVKVTRPGHVKMGGMELLRGDDRYDYEVVIKGELEDLRETILNIAQSIKGNEG